MDVEPLIDAVGHDRFRSACEWAWRTAARTGEQLEVEAWPDDLAQVPHELSDLWDDLDVPLIERLHAAQELYRQMPCSGLLMYSKHAFSEFGADEFDAFWSDYRSFLEHDDDRLADPVAYSLWVDFFEDPEVVEQAWRESTNYLEADGANRRIERVLRCSGPVPYRIKIDMYHRLALDHRWHDHIARGLVGSAFDTYGDIDPFAASSLLARLDVSDDLPGLIQLRRLLTNRT